MLSIHKTEFWSLNMSNNNNTELDYFLTPLPNNSPERFEQLRLLMQKLRAEDGCPWDREQTLESLQKYVIEEAHEVAEAMQKVYEQPTDKNWKLLCDEVGDLLLECLFVAQFGAEAGKFNVYDSLELLRQKMVRRHPHIFSNTTVKNSEDVLKNWEQIKQEEQSSL